MGREPAARVDGDGVRIREHPGARLVLRLVGGAAALVVVGTLVAVVVIRRSGAQPLSASTSGAAKVPPPRLHVTTPEPSAPAVAPAAPPRAPVTIRPRHQGEPAATTAPTPPANVGTLGGKDAILALRAAGETGGLAAFGVPGTDPPKEGLVVPDDFALPPGYVRHYQATDDGQPLPPVLTVHPDYELVDAEGRVVPLPESRIVPPELAPPGMPVQTLHLPEPTTDTGPRR